jgi:hypothetical protein
MQTAKQLYREYLNKLGIAIEVEQALERTFADSSSIQNAINFVYKYDALANFFLVNVRRNGVKYPRG